MIERRIFAFLGVRNFGGWVTPKVNDIIADPRFPLPDRLGESWKVRDRYNVSDLTQLVDRSNLVCLSVSIGFQRT